MEETKSTEAPDPKSNVQHIANFADIEAEFIQRAHAAPLCNAATVDSRQRPRSRVLHPVWEGSMGWITTRHDSPKIKQLAANPAMSLAYIADLFRPIYVDCMAVWVDDLTTRRRVWDLLRSLPEPVGFDPALTWGDIEKPENGLLRLRPWRGGVNDFVIQPTVTKVWRAAT